MFKKNSSTNLSKIVLSLIIFLNFMRITSSIKSASLNASVCNRPNTLMHGWNIPTIDLLDALQEDKEFSDPHKSIATLFTVLDKRNTARTNNELIQLYENMQERGVKLKDLIVFQENRLLLHEIIIFLSTKIQLSNENELHLYTRILFDSFSNFIRQGEKHSFSVSDSFKQALALSSKELMFNKDYRNTTQTLVNSLFDAQLIKSFNDFEEENFYSFVDLFYGEVLQRVSSVIIQSKIEAWFKKILENNQVNSFKPIKIPIHHKRITFMINGGVSSGKGSSVFIHHKEAKKLGINWRDVVKINSDSYKPLILDFMLNNTEFYSQLAQQEASIINRKIQKRLYLMAMQKKAPHVLIDQVFVGRDQLATAIMTGGMCKIIVVSTNVSESIKRAYTRGCNTLRFEDTKGVLRSHKFMTAEIPKTLSEFSGENISLMLVDNNVKENELPISVMTAYLQNKTVNIFDASRLNNFIKKTIINVDAKNEEDVYEANNKEMSINDYFTPFLNKNFNITYFSPNDKKCETVSHSNLSLRQFK